MFERSSGNSSKVWDNTAKCRSVAVKRLKLGALSRSSMKFNASSESKGLSKTLMCVLTLKNS